MSASQAKRDPSEAHVDSGLLARALFALLLYAAFSLGDPNYATLNNLYAVIDSGAMLGLVALGLGITMIAGELDFSVGSVAAVAGILTIRLAGLGFLPAILLVLPPAILFGAAQGYGIAKLRINSLVFTIGTMIAIRGLTYVVADNQSWALDTSLLSFAEMVSRQIGLFSPYSLTTIGVMVGAGFIFSRVRSAREIYAIGGGPNEAVAAGVSPVRPRVIAFAACAGLAALAGALTSMKSGSASPYAFDGIMLSGVTAALIGGVSLYGGKGSILGIAIGVLTLRFVITGMTGRGAPFWVATLATGCLLVVFLLIELFTDADRRNSLILTARRVTSGRLGRHASPLIHA